VNRVELIRRISRAAKQQGVLFASTGAGTRHELFMLGTTKIPIPRHAEIGRRTTEDILHECQGELGEGWWRK
jgi:hypothetical protein